MKPNALVVLVAVAVVCSVAAGATTAGARAGPAEGERPAVGPAGVERPGPAGVERASPPGDGSPAAVPSAAVPSAAVPSAAVPSAAVPSAAGGAAGVQAGACNFTDVFDRASDSVVTVRVFDRRGDRGLGSGWVYATNGSSALVVTNWHVVEGALGADVQFADGEWRPATELLGVDPYSDLAVLRVRNATADVEALPLADDPPEEGEQVLALGSPLGLEGTVTRGIVSAVDRSVTVGDREAAWTVSDTVQIDAAISPGNSGGPLVDCDGRVVGVNFASASLEVSQNVNFAISADAVRRVVPALVETGSFEHSYLGVRGVSVSPTLARVNDLDGSTEGVLLTSVVPGTPASEVLRGSSGSDRVTGLPVGGDVVVAVDGTEVDDVDELRDYLFEHTRPGETVTLALLRDGRRVERSVTLAAKPLPPERPVSGRTSI